MATRRVVDQVGRVLGQRYRLLTILGSGASSRVFLADDITLERRVAVKLLHPALAGDEAFLRRFRAEARAAAALSHPNVMAVYDWGEEEDGPYLVCEYLEGGSLRMLLDRQQRITLSQALMIGLETARGLDYAHRRGLVHRDIKPANLLFDGDGRLRIGDFGLARALAEAAWTEPDGAMVGTARYAAPEQARAVAVDGRADVYALGLVVIEAVTGSVPFAAESAVATLMARLESPVEVPPELGPLRAVLERVGRVEPQGRPEAGALAGALEEVARALPRPAALPLADPFETELGGPLTGVLVSDTTVHAPDRPFDAEAPMAKARRRRRWPRVLLVITLLLALGGGAAALWPLRAPAHALPRLVGRSEGEAGELLRALGLRPVMSAAFAEGTVEGQVLRQRPAAGVTLREGTTVRLVISKGPPPVPVPDLDGLDLAGATERLVQAGLVVGVVTERYMEDVAKGGVLEWGGKGLELPKGAPVDLLVSAGPEPRLVDNWVGRPFEEVAAALRQAGLVPVRAEAFSDTVAPGTIIATAPGPGAKVDKGGRVSLTVSKGPDLIVVPDVRGASVTDATARLGAAGLSVSNVFGPPNRSVFFLDPNQGAKVRRGSAVNLYTR